jgi:hypothetical protein
MTANWRDCPVVFIFRPSSHATHLIHQRPRSYARRALDGEHITAAQVPAGG